MLRVYSNNKNECWVSTIITLGNPSTLITRKSTIHTCTKTLLYVINRENVLNESNCRGSFDNSKIEGRGSFEDKGWTNYQKTVSVSHTCMSILIAVYFVPSFSSVNNDNVTRRRGAGDLLDDGSGGRSSSGLATVGGDARPGRQETHLGHHLGRKLETLLVAAAQLAVGLLCHCHHLHFSRTTTALEVNLLQFRVLRLQHL